MNKIPKKIEAFSNEFVKQLGLFVQEMNLVGEKRGLSKTEIKWVAATAFKLLGRDARKWSDKVLAEEKN